MALIAPLLDFALRSMQNGSAAAPSPHPEWRPPELQRRSVRARRILEPENAVVSDFLQQERVSSNSASVSPGKPTMMSLVRLISRLADFIHEMRSRYCSRV